ncbi:hypothetical protein JZ751_006004 [Albula glossodonta]|uniref:Uncharacterized protein n=1 Tax=Albula glossodonta TaxID=121402 RepID=A0A8T2PE99_9TELE|nr:hypothetical protein JZ751_006004 [Albula glossodonta]
MREGRGLCTDCGVLRAGCNAEVIERIPFDVQHISSVATHSRVMWVYFPRLKGTPGQTDTGKARESRTEGWEWSHVVNGDDQESPAPCTLCDDSNEAWVDGTEMVVLDAPGDRNAIVAVLLGGSLTEHMPELGAAILGPP